MRAAFKGLKALKVFGPDTVVPVYDKPAYALDFLSETLGERTRLDPYAYGVYFYFDLLTGGTASIADLIKVSAYKKLLDSAANQLAVTPNANPYISPLVKTGLVPGRHYVFDQTGGNYEVYDAHVQVTLSAGATFVS